MEKTCKNCFWCTKNKDDETYCDEDFPNCPFVLETDGCQYWEPK